MASLSSLIPRFAKGLFSSSQVVPVEKDFIPESSFAASSPSGSKLGSPANGEMLDGDGDVDMHRDSIDGQEQEAVPEPQPESVKRKNKKKKRVSKGKEVRGSQVESEDVGTAEPPPILPGHTGSGKKRVSQVSLLAQEESMVDETPVKSAQSKSKQRSKGKKRISKGVEEEVVNGTSVMMNGLEQNGSMMDTSGLNVEEAVAQPEVDNTPSVKKPKKSKKKSLPLVDAEPENREEEDAVMDETGAQNEVDLTPAVRKPRKSKRKSLPVVEPEVQEEEDVVMDDAPATKKSRKSKKKASPVVEAEPPEEAPIDDPPAPRTNGKVRAPRKSKSNVSAKNGKAPEPKEVEPAVGGIENSSNSTKEKARATITSVGMEEVHDPEPEPGEDISTPKGPSANALGKRKATESLARKSQKKRKGSVERGSSSSVSLLDFSFTKERSATGERSLGVDESENPSRDLRNQTSADPLEEQEPPVEPKSSKSNTKRKSKAKPPVVLGSSRPSTATGKKDAPVYTSARKLAKSANILFVESDDSLEDVPQSTKPTPRKKRRLLVDDGDELGPSSVKSKKSSQLSMSQTPQKEKEKPQRKGKISDEELQDIVNAVNLYQEMHDLSDYQVAEIIQQTEGALPDEHTGFWKEIRDAVPELPNRKVFETCRRRFHNFEARGSWTEEQDEELKKAYERFPQKWKLIGGMINRFPEDARDRWRNYLVCGQKLRKHNWDKEEEEKLREVVFECIETLKKRREKGDRNHPPEYWEELIDWGIVSAKMNLERSRLQCIRKWKQMKERGGSEDERLLLITHTEWREAEAVRIAQDMSADEILKLLRLIRDSGAGKESNIPWILIVEQLGEAGKNRRMAYKVCFRKLRTKIPGGEDMKFREVVEFLIDVFETVYPRYPEAYRDHEIIKEVRRRNRPSKKTLEAEEIDFDPSDQILQESAGDNGEGSSKQKTAKAKPAKAARKGDKSTSRNPPASNDEELDTENHLPLGSQKPFRAAKPKNRQQKSSLDEESAEPTEEQQTSEPKKKSRKSRAKAKAASPPPGDEVIEPFVETDAEEEEVPAGPPQKNSRKSKSKGKAQLPQPDEEPALEPDEDEEQQQSSKLKKSSRKSRSKAKVPSPQIDEEIPEDIPEADLEQEHEQPPPSKKKPQKPRPKSKAKVSPLSEERIVDSDPDEEPQPVPTSSGKKPRKSNPVVEPPRSDGEEKSEQLSPTKRKNKKLRDRMIDQEEEDSEQAIEGYGFAADMSDDMSEDEGLDDLLEGLRSGFRLAIKKYRQEDVDDTRVKEMGVHQQLLSTNDDEEILDASEFSEPETNGHAQEDVEMVEVVDEPQVNGYISEQESDAPIEEEASSINGHASGEDSDVPDEQEDGNAAQDLDNELVVNGHQNADDFKTAPPEFLSPSVSVLDEEPLVNGQLSESQHELASPEVSDVEENSPSNEIVNGDPVENHSDIDDDSNNFGYNGGFNDSDTSDDIDERPRNVSTDVENQNHPEDMEIDPVVPEGQYSQTRDLSLRLQASQAIPTGSSSANIAVVVKTEDLSDIASNSESSKSADHLDDLDDNLVGEQEAKIFFPYPEASDSEDQAESYHEVEAVEMDHDDVSGNDNESEDIQYNRQEVEYTQPQHEFDEGPAQVESDESDGELIFDGFANQHNIVGDMADDEVEEEFDEAPIVPFKDIARETPIEVPETDPIEQDRVALTPEPVVSRNNISPDLDTPPQVADDPTRPVSPDLDTPLRLDGRSPKPREFRKRVKKINYNDAAALVEVMESSEDDFVAQPKRGKGRKSAGVETDHRSDSVNNFPPDGFVSQNRDHGRPVTPHRRKRRESESSSDYSIPAEATPLYVRAERDFGDDED